MHLSNDLDIATKLKPDQAVLDEFVRSRNDLNIGGTLGVGDTNLVLNRHTAEGLHTCAEIYGPFTAEDDDISHKLATTIPSPRWLLQIVVPAGNQEDVSTALSLAQHIASRCHGAVFDPQADAVVWHNENQSLLKRLFSTKPKAQATATVQTTPQRIREVTLEWFLPISYADPRTAKTFLSTLRTVCPEAVPVRFGTFEPFQGRLPKDDDSPFVDAWNKASKAKVVGDVSFKSKSPCFGGSVYVSGPEAMHGDEGIRHVHLSTQFDGRPIEADWHWREKLVSLLITMSKSLNAFYAHAYIQRNVVLHGKSVGYDGKTEIYPLPMGIRWKGIPPTPVWLRWFGRPYMDLVRDAFPNMDIQKMPEGLFVRSGKEPLDLDKLGHLTTRLPNNVLAKMGEDRRAGPADLIPLTD